MLSIFAKPEYKAKLQAIIDTEYRLHEVVQCDDIQALNGHKNYLLVEEAHIVMPLRWAAEVPPYLLPSKTELNTANLLALVYVYLNNFEKAYQFAEKNKNLLHEIDQYNKLQHGIEQNVDTEFATENYRQWHNTAVLAHYGVSRQFLNVFHIKKFYQKALNLSPNGEYFAYTSKHYATLLLDADELHEAETILENGINQSLSDEAKMELKAVLYGIWLKKMTVPYDEQLLTKLKNTLWEVLEYYEMQGNQVQIALLLIDAAQVANFGNSFTESLGYVSRAIAILDQENIPELQANAQYRKGVLLYTWAQNGNPQFFKPAMEAYQQALKVFTYEHSPEIFAEIQHHLGVIYSEIPDEAKKKSLWAAISVSSFNQALQYFLRETHPYEFAMVCNSYANALTKFPASAINDNYAKALNFYRLALEVRSASEYPLERALSIINFLEAAYYVGHQNKAEEHALLSEMHSLASEIKDLSANAELVNAANEHLARIVNLKLLFEEKK